MLNLLCLKLLSEPHYHLIPELHHALLQEVVQLKVVLGLDQLRPVRQLRHRSHLRHRVLRLVLLDWREERRVCRLSIFELRGVEWCLLLSEAASEQLLATGPQVVGGRLVEDGGLEQVSGLPLLVVDQVEEHGEVRYALLHDLLREQFLVELSGLRFLLLEVGVLRVSELDF